MSHPNGVRGGGIGAWFEASADRIGELILGIGAASLKAWNVYQDRRDKRRAGRRASDRDYATMKKAIARLETIAAELEIGLTRCHQRCDALERARAEKR